MASTIRTPRSVSDATRFTPTTPHAGQKARGTSAPTSIPTSSSSSASVSPSTAVKPSSTSRFLPPTPSSGEGSGAGGSRPPAGARRVVTETPEQRVARLRAAHLAARNAQIPMFDRVVSKTRGVFDAAHRVTAMGLIGLTAIATLVTAYAAVDMMTFNRKRKAEFIEAQRKMHADSLEAARLAYMRGDATDEQVALVEGANARGQQTGSFFSNLPSVISAPRPISGSSSSEASSTGGHTVSSGAKEEEKGSSSNGWGNGIRGYFGGRKQDGVAAAAEGAVVRSVGDKARTAFDKERENERKGGPLDRIETGVPTVPQPDAGARDSGSDGASERKRWWS